MTETLRHRAEQDHQVDHEHVRSALGALSLDHAANLVASFHGADEHRLGRRADMPGKINSIVSTTNEHGQSSNEIIAQGESVEEALYETFLGMRKLETVKAKPLMRMEIQAGMDVDFTTLEHYAPKVAPTAEAYPVPEHLNDLLEGNTLGRSTYDKTTEIEGWGKQIFSQVERFTQTERGKELASDLKIQSLQTLTPEQAVKITLSMVHDLSKYLYDEKGQPDLEAARVADQKTVMELLEDGFAHKDDPNWQGNGVCRNIASNVRAVFESLKMNQTNVNMLHNTYVGYTGSNEDFRVQKRHSVGDAEKTSFGGEPGHAWNTITTVDAKGDASVTIVDVTWSLSKSPEEAISSMDYTLTRSARKARELFETSADKTKSFHDLNNYYKAYLSEGFRKHRQTAQFESMIQFTMKEYLSAARTVMSEAPPEWVANAMPNSPGYIQGAADRLGDNLSKGEFETLFKLSEVGALTNFDAIFNSYVRGGKNDTIDAGTRAQSLAFPAQPELSRAIFEALDEARIKQYAERWPEFKILARQYSPDSLPPFDPDNNFDDQKELAELARQNRLNVASGNPRMVAGAVNRGLLNAAGGDQEAVARATEGRDLYVLVRDYQQIRESLLGDSTNHPS